MKAAWIADPHLHNFKEFGSTVLYPELDLPINSRLLEQLTTIMNIAKAAKLRGCTHLFVNGDLFHIRGSVPTDVYQYTWMLLNTIVNVLGIKVVVLVGNHDQADKSGSIHSVFGLRQLVTVVDKPGPLTVDGVTVYCIPYIADKDKLVAELEKAHGQILFAHLGVDGSYIGPIEYKIKDPITADHLHSERFDWVLLGHYHKPQAVAKNAYYIGSPAQVNRGEIGESKRWMYWDSDKPKKLTSIWTHAKEFKRMTREEFLEADVNELQDYIDVTVPSELANDEAMLAKAQGLHVKFMPVKKDAGKVARIKDASVMTDTELLTAYIAQKQIVDDDKLLYLGLRLLDNSAPTASRQTRVMLLRVIADNFLTIGHVSLKLHQPGSVISVQGDNQTTEGFTSNGAGKSTLLPESVYWCLWGVTARELPADKVVNRVRKRNCAVRLDLVVGNKKIAVTRYRKHKEFGGDGLKLVINGSDVTQGTPALTQKMLDDELGVDFTTFSSVVTFSPDTLRFVKETDAKQKHVLDSILQTRRFTAALDLAKKAISTVRSTRVSTSQEAETKRSALEQLQSLSTQYQELNASWERREAIRVDGLKSQILLEENSIEVTTGAVLALKGTWDELDVTLQSKIVAASKLLDVDDSMDKAVSNLAVTTTSLQNHVEAEAEVQANLDSALNQVGKPCPTCGQAVTNTGKLIAKYQQRRNDLAGVIAGLRLKQTQQQEHKARLQRDRDAARLLDTQIEQLKSQMAAKQRSIDAMTARLVGYTNNIESLNAQILSVPVNDYETIIPANQHQIDVAEAELRLLEADLRRKTRNEERLQFWVNGFGSSGVRSYLLDCILPTLTEYSNQFMNKLSGGSIQISFQTYKEGVSTDRFQIRAVNADGSDVYKGNSSGEKRRIDMCIMLGMFRVAFDRTKFNVLLLDEALDTLDEAGLESVVELLHDFAEELQLAIYVTSHTSLSSMLHESITIVKHAGISSLA